jgi:NAD(P)-dependent dehydrogenase (short-subunit alcohol dehydrogenase family)
VADRVVVITGAFGALGSAVAAAAAAAGDRLALIDFAGEAPPGLPSGEEVFLVPVTGRL